MEQVFRRMNAMKPWQRAAVTGVALTVPIIYIRPTIFFDEYGVRPWSVLSSGDGRETSFPWWSVPLTGIIVTGVLL